MTALSRMSTVETSDADSGELAAPAHPAPTSASSILSGDWPPGHRIPFEHELTAAVRLLAHDGEQGAVGARRRPG